MMDMLILNVHAPMMMMMMMVLMMTMAMVPVIMMSRQLSKSILAPI